ncbi:MAG: glycerol-3-phosphate acyltransferase [Bacteroidota bacterium]
MNLLHLTVSVIAAYLSGSVSFAILITRWVTGKDIRTLGNCNPGTSNVGRSVGKGWALLVLTGDLLKGLLPLFLAQSLLFPGKDPYSYFSLILTGAAAITGHCFPLFYGFRGGGGLATSVAVYLFFIPFEFLFTLILSFSLVMLFFRKKQFPVGQLTPMFFVPLAPLLLLAGRLLPGLTLCGIRLNPPRSGVEIAGIALLSVLLFLINIRIVLTRFSSTDRHE